MQQPVRSLRQCLQRILDRRETGKLSPENVNKPKIALLAQRRLDLVD